jgi:hypothetical protein
MSGSALFDVVYRFLLPLQLLARLRTSSGIGLGNRKHSRYYSESLLNVDQESSLRSRGGPRSSTRVYLWLLLHLQLETRLRPSETLNFEALIYQSQSIACTFLRDHIHYANKGTNSKP